MSPLLPFSSAPPLLLAFSGLVLALLVPAFFLWRRLGIRTGEALCGEFSTSAFDLGLVGVAGSLNGAGLDAGEKRKLLSRGVPPPLLQSSSSEEGGEETIILRFWRFAGGAIEAMSA